jgi:hypothetical protein
MTPAAEIFPQEKHAMKTQNRTNQQQKETYQPFYIGQPAAAEIFKLFRGRR